MLFCKGDNDTNGVCERQHRRNSSHCRGVIEKIDAGQNTIQQNQGKGNHVHGAVVMTDLVLPRLGPSQTARRWCRMGNSFTLIDVDFFRAQCPLGPSR